MRFRPVYTQTQINVVVFGFFSLLISYFLEKLKSIFSFTNFSHSPGAVLFIHTVFDTKGYSGWQYWQYAQDLETEVSISGLQICIVTGHLFPCCFSTFSISLFPLHFVKASR